MEDKGPVGAQYNITDNPHKGRAMDPPRQLDIELEALKAYIRQLEAALEPFAKAADGFDSYNIKNPEEWFAYGGVQGSGETTGAITVGDLRRARDVKRV